MLCLAETDLVLPLIRKNASCLDVKNNDGCTARELLQDFKDRMNQTEEPEVVDSAADFFKLTRLMYYTFELYLEKLF